MGMGVKYGLVVWQIAVMGILILVEMTVHLPQHQQRHTDGYVVTGYLGILDAVCQQYCSAHPRCQKYLPRSLWADVEFTHHLTDGLNMIYSLSPRHARHRDDYHYNNGL